MAERVPLTQEQLMELDSTLNSLGSEWDESKVSIMFNLLDRDGNGTISSTELRTVMSQLTGARIGEAVAQEFLEEADTNGDGVIQLTEFFEFIRKNTP
jgi:Ca2+-binding EF-hand superfamily protein